jgi:hypothetical protein
LELSLVAGVCLPEGDSALGKRIFEAFERRLGIGGPRQRDRPRFAAGAKRVIEEVGVGRATPATETADANSCRVSGFPATLSIADGRDSAAMFSGGTPQLASSSIIRRTLLRSF